jgi:predicted site-specific integrase-resolvase
MTTLSPILELDALLTAPEAAKILTIATVTLSRWRYQGHPHIPYIKIGGRVRYRTTDIKAYINKHTIAEGVTK